MNLRKHEHELLKIHGNRDNSSQQQRHLKITGGLNYSACKQNKIKNNKNIHMRHLDWSTEDIGTDDFSNRYGLLPSMLEETVLVHC